VPHAPVTLWTIGPISCTCVTLPDNQIEICLVSGTTVIERRLFPDPDRAANYAVEKMHAYTVH
jgi:hypothetical protein